MFQLPTTKSSILTVFKKTFLLWKHAWIEITGIALLFTAIAGVPHFFIPFHTETVSELFSIIKDIQYFYPLFYFLFILFGYSLLLNRIKSSAQVPQKNFLQDLGNSLKSFPALILAFILFNIVVSLAQGVFIVPGIFLKVLLALYLPLVILEKRGPFKAFNYSCFLIWGNWWRTAIIFSIPLFVFIAILISAEESLAHLWVIRLEDGMTIKALHNLSRIVSYTLFMSFFSVLIVIQLNDLKIRETFKKP